jgi:DNA polymerase III subunit delta
MVAIKAHQAQAFLDKPSPALSAFLFYGTDPGLISKRAATLAQALSKSSSPAGEIIRLSDSDVEADSNRLSIEMQTIAMFGGAKVIRVSQSQRFNTNVFRPLLASETLTGRLIVEAGNLRPDEALRKLFEKSNMAAAIACYADSSQDLEGLITQVLSKTQQTISLEARHLLLARLGGDHGVSIGELEKLTLYTHGRREITSDDIEAIVGDGSEMVFDKIVFTAAAGDIDVALREFSRIRAAGESPHAVVAMALRHFHRLHTVSAVMATGKRLDDALKQLRPAVHFKQKSAFQAQVRIWTSDLILKAYNRIDETTKALRRSGSLEAVEVERMLIRLAQMARRSNRQPLQRL